MGHHDRLQEVATSATAHHQVVHIYMSILFLVSIVCARFASWDNLALYYI
jgi:hypothetical protein